MKEVPREDWTVPHHRPPSAAPSHLNREILEAIYKDLRKPEAEADMTEVTAGRNQADMDDVGRK